MYFNLTVTFYPETSLAFLGLEVVIVLVFDFSMCLGLPWVACHSILYPTASNFNYFPSEKQTSEALFASLAPPLLPSAWDSLRTGPFPTPSFKVLFG